MIIEIHKLRDRLVGFKYHLVPVLPRLIFQPSTRAGHGAERQQNLTINSGKKNGKCESRSPESLFEGSRHLIIKSKRDNTFNTSSLIRQLKLKKVNEFVLKKVSKFSERRKRKNKVTIDEEAIFCMVTN